eukprot:gene12707-biopygen8836
MGGLVVEKAPCPPHDAAANRAVHLQSFQWPPSYRAVHPQRAQVPPTCRAVHSQCASLRGHLPCSVPPKRPTGPHLPC